MLASRKWAAIQPKCTLYVDCAAGEWALYLTNSPEDELRMIGLDPAQRDRLRVVKNETTPPIHNGIAIAIYHVDHTVSVYNGNIGRREERDTLIGTGICNIRGYIIGMSGIGRGRFWATFGGRKVMSRIVSQLHNPSSVTFIDKAGTEFTQRQPSQWAADFYRIKGVTHRFHERDDSVGLETASIVMSTGCNVVSAKALPVDEDQIDRD